MDQVERQARWRALWSAIENRSPVIWGRSFVAALLRATSPVAPRAIRPSAGYAPSAEQIIPAALPPQRISLEHLDLEPVPTDPRRLN